MRNNIYIVLGISVMLLGTPLKSVASENEVQILRIHQSGQGELYNVIRIENSKENLKQHLLRDKLIGGQLVAIGKNKNGKELFRRIIRDPGVRVAEYFDHDTGELISHEEVYLENQEFDLAIPNLAELDRIDILRNVDSEDKHTLKSHSNPLSTISRNEIENARLASYSNEMIASTNVTTTSLYNSGPYHGRMNIVIIGDGYTANQMGDWHNDARSVFNGIMTDSLFSSLRNYFNVFRMDIASTQSGVSVHGQPSVSTALGAVLGCNNIERLLCINDRWLSNAINSGLRATPLVKRADVVVVISNTELYGGGGSPNYASVTMHRSHAQVALHELGHHAFGLADEYDYGTCNSRASANEPNLSKTAENFKWRSHLGSGVDGYSFVGPIQIPTTPGSHPNGFVSAFEGAKYCTSGFFRPTENSKMRSSHQPWHKINEMHGRQVIMSYYVPPIVNPIFPNPPCEGCAIP